jgi:hypothetical protein
MSVIVVIPARLMETEVIGVECRMVETKLVATGTYSTLAQLLIPCPDRVNHTVKSVREAQDRRLSRQVMSERFARQTCHSQCSLGGLQPFRR